MLFGGALANALAFTGSSYLFHRLSADSIDVRHDVAIEALQKAQIVHVPNFGGLSGSEDRGGGDNSIQFMNFWRVGDKSFK